MSQSTFEKTVWVLGNGQLGDMLRQAGYPINIEVRPIGISAESIPELAAEDIVTAEQELWPETPATAALSAHPRFINQSVFGQLADRYTQKQLLDSLSIPTAPWQLVTTDVTATKLWASLGAHVLLKQRTGGYDGKGQHWLHQGSEAAAATNIPEGWHDKCIAEAAIAFEAEISIVAARNHSGDFRSYPLSLNHHVDGVLAASISGLERICAYQQQAEQIIEPLLHELDYCGVLAMECFLIDGQLLVNELAPRVHNSGHWTQTGASYSQFSAHLRAICDLPMPKIISRPTVMVNLLGTPWCADWLSLPSAQVHWYHKSVRPGRKLGHINIDASNSALAQETLAQLAQMLPDSYQNVIKWVKTALQAA